MHHQAHQDLVDAEDFQEEEDEIAMDFDNIEALQDFLGEQNPRIFSPRSRQHGPSTDRTTHCSSLARSSTR